MRKTLSVIALALLVVLVAFGCSKSTEPDKQVATPVFAPEGGTYSFEKQVLISCATEGATIRYTLDESEPNSSSTLYTEPILVSADLIIKAKAYKKGWTSSPVATASYSFVPADTLAAPVFSPEAGLFYSEQRVTISSSDPEAVIRYTTDGREPDESSTLYVSPILVSSSITLKAKAFKPETVSSPTTNGIYSIWQMMPVQGGTFHNGVSNVTLSSFYISNYEVTQAQYQAVVGENPSHFADNPDHPVETVSWSEAIRYCNLRSELEGLTPCYSWQDIGTNVDEWPSNWILYSIYYVTCDWEANGYRLPTEMEWMFAARGGNLSHDYSYSGSENLAEVAWYNVNSGGNTHRVGSKAPNELGLFDLSGNVWEWVWDSYAAYPTTDQSDPQGPSSREYPVLRGGSWTDPSGYCKVNFRLNNKAYYANFHVGFRVVRKH